MKNVINLLAVLLIGGTLLLASNQRVSALGGNAAYWPEDDANIWVFPHAVNNYNLANTDGSDFYVSWGDGMKFGFAGGMDSDMLNMTWGQDNMGVNFGLNMTPAVDAVAGVTDSMNCGDTMDQACDNGVDAVLAADAGQVVHFGFGMGMDFGDLGVWFNNDAGTNLNLHLRRAQDVWIWDNMLVDFGMASPEEGDAEINVGVNCFTHLNIADNTTGLFAMGFGFWNQGEDSDITFPAMTFAVESGMTDWATVRAGFTKDWSISNTSSAGVSPNFGLGFNYGSFNLDMNVGTDLFTNPVGKITGYDPLGAGEFNITYSW